MIAANKMLSGEAGYNRVLKYLKESEELRNLLGKLERQNIALGSSMLKSFILPYAESDKEYYLASVAKDLDNWLDFQPIYVGVGIKAEITKLHAEFPRGIEIANLDTNAPDVHTKWMEINATVRVKCLPWEVGKWEIGFIQTVLRLERELTIRASFGKWDRADSRSHLRAF
jgi:hypothetical protein